MSPGSVRVGVLCLHESKETKAILNAVEGLGHEPELLGLRNLTLRVLDGTVGVDPDVDVVANRILLTNTDTPAEELGVAQTLSALKPMLNTPEATARAAYKAATVATLAAHGMPVPDTMLALDNGRLADLRRELGDHVIYKTSIGTHGESAWKVGPDDPLTAAVGRRRGFLQEFVGGHRMRARDLRVYVVGGEVIGAMYRYAPEGEWRTNVALGGEVEDASDEIPAETLSLATTAVEAIGLDYAGVDLIEGHDGWSVLEVNPTAGFKGLYKATGRSPAPYIAKMAIERAGGEVDEERVDELAATLDDSTPSSKPRQAPTKREDTPLIGYIEEVVVSGTSGSSTTLAKSDTGATRTSIDTSLAAEIGAGPIKSMTRVKSGSVKGGKARPVVDLVIGIGGRQHTVTASVEDRSHMDYPLLLGRDILQHYQVDVRRRVDSDSPKPDDSEEILEEE